MSTNAGKNAGYFVHSRRIFHPALAVAAGYCHKMQKSYLFN